jgi:UDP-N-acetylmuramoylalanine--D-glutamate ligase
MAQIGGFASASYFSLHAASEWRLQQGALMHNEEVLCQASDMRLLGKHNIANALAALALLQGIGVAADSRIIEALQQFKGLPHRVEHIATINGVDYIDDSKGTNVGATVAALEGLGTTSVLIAGGVGKQQDFSPLLPAVNAHCRAVCLIGEASKEIAQALSQAQVPVVPSDTLDKAVRQAEKIARPGEAVLLSPACASFDQFRDYLHRSEVFAQAVAALAKEAG